MFLITLIDRDRFMCIFLLIAAMGFNGFNLAGFTVTHVDMAPNFAGTLMGLTNCVSNFAGILAPYTVGIILSTSKTDEQILDAWHTVFYLSSGCYVLATIVFALLASNQLQKWNNLDESDVNSKNH